MNLLQKDPPLPVSNEGGRQTDDGLQSTTKSIPRVGAWAPLKNRLFAAFWIVGLVSNLGTWMHELAAAYYMTLLEPSPVWVSLVRTSMTLPVFVFALLAGALADRVDRRKLLILTQVFLCVITMAMSLLTLFDRMTPVGLLACTLAIGLGMCVHIPTWQSLLPEIVTKREIPAAVGLGSISFNLARCVGPAISGLVIGFFGVAFAFAANACSFLGVIVVLVSWNRHSQNHARKKPSGVGLFKSLLEGLRYLLSDSKLRNVYLRVVTFVAPASVIWSLIPLVARERFCLDARGLGLLVSTFGFGAVAGAMVLPTIRERLGSNWIVFMLTLLFSIACIPIAISTSAVVAGIAMMATGASWMGILTTLNATIQLILKDEFRARGMSLYLTMISFSMAFGPLLWGFLGEHIGTSPTFLVAAVVASWLYLATIKVRLVNISQADAIAAA